MCHRGLNLPNRQQGNIKQEQVLHLLRCVTRKDSSLNGGTIRDGPVKVDVAIGLLAREEVGNKLMIWEYESNRR
jgi:hypothetical protein